MLPLNCLSSFSFLKFIVKGSHCTFIQRSKLTPFVQHPITESNTCTWNHTYGRTLRKLIIWEISFYLIPLIRKTVENRNMSKKKQVFKKKTTTMVVSSAFPQSAQWQMNSIINRLIHTRQRRSSSLFSPGERKIPPATAYSHMITFKFSTDPHYTLTHQSRARQGGKLKANRWIIKERKNLKEHCCV